MIRALQSWQEILDARAELRRLGVDFTSRWRLLPWHVLYALRFRARPLRADLVKSWDVLHALHIIRRHLPSLAAPVLDMGCFNSEVLWALHVLGYRDLTGCDLNPMIRLLPYWHRIAYVTADLTRTPFPDHRFAAITCLSTVEHGVEVPALVAEVRRLLRSGGLFILTTDFDGSGAAHDVDPAFRAFGQSWTLFDRERLQALCERFLSAGFTFLEPGALDMHHAERPIRWSGEEYTFALVALRKT
jgi:SAM-dependent methyltransferase